MLDGTHYYECTCGAPDHTLRFILDHGNAEDVNWPPTIYTEVMMSHFRPWYKRVWISIRYVFGMDTVDHFGGWELNRDDADRLIKMLEDFKAGEAKYLADNKIKMHNPSTNKAHNDPSTNNTEHNLYGGNEYEQNKSV